MSSSDDSKNDRVNEFLQLLAQCERRLYGYILALVQHFHDADDIAQETRTRLWEQFDKYESGTNFEAWARTIAYYQVQTHREKARRQRLSFRQDVIDKISADYAEATDALSSRHAALLSCLESVNVTARRLLDLVYAQGLSIKDAATRLGRPVEGTYKALARARRGLQECIERKTEGGGP